ncbi:putative O-methyltransferase [Candidatus Methanoperedens nitroreducens]|uniref:Putative O-methyltransferase n=1 Tax=Candidatus Methanoperedens nitratireducens TaxID=1392998 RepID=A0A062V4E4_9EURY|nr:class I SAM-dependent methyltransferase [Candidatus Methanoperedens nitroreducens]KCZ70285.1 putative O-methyltransferase [Candidatus Methanoperedens nitroreducens]MDJ1423125.1 class I SAM-dependent methyltransferase [Candidatus Methanoperedens sp.]
MDRIVPEKIERYCRDNTTPESHLLRELVVETYARTAFPEMQVGHLEGAFLRMLVRLQGAKRILEIGTFTGYSSLVMAEALPEDGELITCDIDPEVTQIAQRYWSQSPHGKKIELRLGHALDTLKTIEGPFDMVFIDADKVNYINYWELCVPRMRSGGLLVADNVLWGGSVLDPRDETDRAIVEFNEHVYSDKRVETVMLPIRDGITLAWKF